MKGDKTVNNILQIIFKISKIPKGCLVRTMIFKKILKIILCFNMCH